MLEFWTSNFLDLLNNLLYIKYSIIFLSSGDRRDLKILKFEIFILNIFNKKLLILLIFLHILKHLGLFVPVFPALVLKVRIATIIPLDLILIQKDSICCPISGIADVVTSPRHKYYTSKNDGFLNLCYCYL